MTNTDRKIVDHMLALQAELDAERARRFAETQRADRERTLRIAAEQDRVQAWFEVAGQRIDATELAELRGRAELVEVLEEDVERLRADRDAVLAERDGESARVRHLTQRLEGAEPRDARSPVSLSLAGTCLGCFHLNAECVCDEQAAERMVPRRVT